MTGLLSWHGKPYPPEINIREMPAALKRLATLSNVGVVRPDFNFKASNLYKSRETEKDHSQQNHEAWFLAGGEGSSSQQQDARKYKEVAVVHLGRDGCADPVLLNHLSLSDASLRLILEYQDLDIDSILTIMTEQEVDGIISFNNGCVPDAKFEEKASELNELVTLRGAAVGLNRMKSLLWRTLCSSRCRLYKPLALWYL